MGSGPGKDSGEGGRGKRHQNAAATTQPKKGQGKQSKWASSGSGGVSKSQVQAYKKATTAAAKKEIADAMNPATRAAVGL